MLKIIQYNLLVKYVIHRFFFWSYICSFSNENNFFEKRFTNLRIFLIPLEAKTVFDEDFQIFGGHNDK